MSGTHIELGLGGGSSSSCDPNGTLYAGLMGYWKMDEASWIGAAGEVRDSSGNGNNGTAYGGANTTFGQSGFGNAGNFDGMNDYVGGGSNSILNFTSGNFTIAAWIKTTKGTGQTIVQRGLSQTDGYTLMADPYVHFLTIDPELILIAGLKPQRIVAHGNIG